MITSTVLLAGLLLQCTEKRLVFAPNGIWAPVERRDAVLPLSTEGTSYLPHLEGGLDRGVNTSYWAKLVESAEGGVLAEIEKVWTDESAIFPTEEQFKVEGVTSAKRTRSELLAGASLQLSYFNTITSTRNRFGYWTFGPADLGAQDWIQLSCEIPPASADAESSGTPVPGTGNP